MKDTTKNGELLLWLDCWNALWNWYWKLVPNATILRSMTFGRWFSHEHSALEYETSTLIKQLKLEGISLSPFISLLNTKIQFIPSEDAGSKCHLWCRVKPSPDTKIVVCCLGVPSLLTIWHPLLLFINSIYIICNHA
jgi:hypothetical protein